jgi:hypothetical protein
MLGLGEKVEGHTLSDLGDLLGQRTSLSLAHPGGLRAGRAFVALPEQVQFRWPQQVLAGAAPSIVPS